MAECFAKGLLANTCKLKLCMLSLLLLPACMHPISEKLRLQADKQTSFEQVLDSPEKHFGSRFLWGGVIAETRNLNNGSEIEIVQKEIDGLGYPDRGDETSGRFIFFTPDYLESTVYAKGRYIVGIGILRKVRTGRVGEMEYMFPIIELEEQHLWENMDPSAYPQYFYSIHPYWDPYFHTYRSPFSIRYW